MTMLWLSIGLLLLTYTVFGWALYELHWEIHLWGALEIGIVFLALLYTIPLYHLKKPLNAWLKSNIGFFLSIIFGAFLIVILATWLEIFTTTLMALSATALTRMELQTRSVKRWKAFFVLCAVSMSGLAIGWGLHHLAGLTFDAADEYESARAANPKASVTAALGRHGGGGKSYLRPSSASSAPSLPASPHPARGAIARGQSENCHTPDRKLSHFPQELDSSV